MADRSTSDDWLRRKILADSMHELAHVDDKATPAEVSHSVGRRTARTLGLADPYAEEKRQWIRETLAGEQRIRERLNGLPNPFAATLHLALAANILDSELRADMGQKVSLRGLLDGFAAVPFASDLVVDLEAAIASAREVLFIHSSAAELFFDRLLIEKMGKPREAVFSIVREAPTLADATLDDARAVGLDQVATLIHPSADTRGLPLDACSEEVRERFRRADLVVAKGQAAYETLENREARLAGGDREGEQHVFFLLRVKCALVARHLGASVGDCVLERAG